jgi:hypothetical protein
MKIFINEKAFELIPQHASISWSPIVIEGVKYDLEDGDALVSVSEEDELRISGLCPTKRHEMPEEITILDRVWLRNDAGTYSRKKETEKDFKGRGRPKAGNKNMKIFINGEKFTITPATSNRAWAPVFIDGVAYAVDDKEKLEAVTRRGVEEWEIEFDHTRILPDEITILDQVWSLNFGGTYNRKQEPTLPFPHAGQVVSLDGVEVEVLHIHGAHFFWYNHEDSFHGVGECADIQTSLIETMRADLAKGLAPKELIALGWSRKC